MLWTKNIGDRDPPGLMGTTPGEGGRHPFSRMIVANCSIVGASNSVARGQLDPVDLSSAAKKRNASRE